MDETLERELFLSKTHENIISQRERLVRQAEWQLEGQEQFQFTLVNKWQQAKKRNKSLLEDIKHFQAVFKERMERPYSADFITLKYWNETRN
ncbi:hypothetical protein BSL78_26457 [Apostichopus japonicus]|uniref:Uncharacterized protein n=1 Tax=Stichopus japonicus TaxID=307972 RepID=A0A2G8JLU2_STIJA|nr:hypothetical protein BSL78_26457 [Apostichopus japonicus]